MWWQLSTTVLSTKEQFNCIDQYMVTVTNWFQLFSVYCNSLNYFLNFTYDIIYFCVCCKCCFKLKCFHARRKLHLYSKPWKSSIINIFLWTLYFILLMYTSVWNACISFIGICLHVLYWNVFLFFVVVLIANMFFYSDQITATYIV